MIIEALEITKKYGRDTILSAVSLGIEAGQSIAVLGPSGSGKTTLLSLLGLLLEPSGGEIRLYDRTTQGLSDGELSNLRNQHFGFVFQSSQLIGSLTVGENVLVPARLAGKAQEKQKRSIEILEQLGLASRIHHLPHQLSFGQKRRVALARALILEPPLIFADEPTNDLDAAMAHQVTERLLALQHQGVALMVATHDRQLAEKLDRRFLIEQGKLTPISVQRKEEAIGGPLT
ncbi:ABC transporter ATP-binding protein [Heliophilum fasciatum]|uniref:Putative ABC transport system ATP-binding protein n=1 Tax=Heliophilum fasciatum TaxID=35700 RepID=A0A4R2RRE7_9FIRM|nr:ATP-binding cassette domain-containing protein [Heliophilum fasciatum]MCW2277680.1 putative ABC transport system ATP-binding protein [Heliophilum fasciatum]TCP65027.1 putative ABC transport system ATP-binding protein [Heliophilum fasciatum]